MHTVSYMDIRIYVYRNIHVSVLIYFPMPQRELAQSQVTVSAWEKSVTGATVSKLESDEDKDREIKLLQSEIKLFQVITKHQI